MKCKQLLSGLALGLGLVLSSSGANANTLNFTGNYSAAGYSQIDFTVGSNAVVDMVFNSGYGDPTFSLFDSAGTHIITNDDSIGLRSHITQNLAAGGYELVVSYCCSFITPMQAQGGGYIGGTDGFNFGSYYGGGSMTLSDLTTYYNNNPAYWAAGAAYDVDISSIGGVTPGSTVPEPGSIALLGLGLAGLAFGRRRKQKLAD